MRSRLTVRCRIGYKRVPGGTQSIGETGPLPLPHRHLVFETKDRLRRSKAGKGELA
jgi:hypothetical protein